MRQQEKLVLVDGSSYLFRAYHGLPPLTSSKGEPTGAIYGVVNMLRKLLRQYPSSHFAVVFDPKGRTSRYTIFPDYKANRSEAPDDLIVQIAPLHAIIKGMGLPLVVVDGYEADDVIGTLARQAQERQLDVVISTGDKDMAQLVNAHVTLVNTMTDTILDEDGVLAKFGVRPDQIIDYLALMGDASDNIPGVTKVGPKTAIKWLTQYGSLDSVIEHADDIKGKVGDNLREALAHLPLSKQLVTLELDVPLPNTLDELVLGEEDYNLLHQWFKRFGFKKWLSELGQKTEGKNVRPDYRAITDEAEWQAWCHQVDGSCVLAIDIESTGLNVLDVDLVGISLATTPHEAVYVPLAHVFSDQLQLDKAKVLEPLKTWLNDPKKTIVGQNLKFDLAILERQGVTVSAPCFDTMLASYVLNSLEGHSLDNMAMRYLGLTTIAFEDIVGKGKQQLTFDQIHLDQATSYAAEDADVALQLYLELRKGLEEVPALEKLFWTLEMPTMRVIQAMETVGVKINAVKLAKQSERLGVELSQLEIKAHEEAEQVFNLASPKQLREILYDQLQLPVTKKTATGEPSTDEEALTGLAKRYALPRLVLQHRTLSKLKSTYTDKLPQLVNARTGRIHTSYNQAVTSTGRFSSTHPNLQNIPIRTKEGRKIREAFIADVGKVLLVADYSQVELRIMAHLSGDEGLIKAFQEGLDIHRATAAEIFGISEAMVTSQQRRHAKAVNFGLIYGMSAFGLAREIGVNRVIAGEYIHRYFTRYPQVKAYMENTRELAAKQSYVETLWGRRLYVPDIHSRQVGRRRAAERAAINAPLQGTAADILKAAMVTLHQQLVPFDAALIMQVHDELVVEVAKGEADQVMTLLQNTMEWAVELDVPLLVDIKSGPHW